MTCIAEHQYELPCMPERRPALKLEDEEREVDVSTCKTAEARRASLRQTLLGYARQRGDNGTAMALAGTCYLEHGELARVVLRRVMFGPRPRLMSDLEVKADGYLDAAGLPEEVQTAALL